MAMGIFFFGGGELEVHCNIQGESVICCEKWLN